MWQLLLISVVSGYYRWYRGPSKQVRITPPSNSQLCGCYNIDLIYEPFLNNDDEICYYYKIKKLSRQDYCSPIQQLSLGTGNLNECGLQTSDIDQLLLDYAPKRNKIDPVSANGIQLTFNSSSLFSDESSSSSSYDSSSSDSAPGSNPNHVFMLCFDSSQVAGYQVSGSIVFGTNEGNYTCNANNILPNLCGARPSIINDIALTCDDSPIIGIFDAMLTGYRVYIPFDGRMIINTNNGQINVTLLQIYQSDETTLISSDGDTNDLDGETDGSITVELIGDRIYVVFFDADGDDNGLQYRIDILCEAPLPYPGQPQLLTCDNTSATGDFINNIIRITAIIPYDGDMTFAGFINGDAVDSLIIYEIDGITIIGQDGDNNDPDGYQNGMRQIRDLQAGTYIIEIDNNEDLSLDLLPGTFEVTVLCTSDEPTGSPTTPSPVDPDATICSLTGNDITGDYNGQSITFEIDIPHTGRMIIDPSSGSVSNASITQIIDENGNSAPFINNGDGTYTVNIDTPNTKLFIIIYAGTENGMYSINVRCETNAPTPSPTHPLLIGCGDAPLVYDYNGESITFSVNIPYNGDMEFDITGSDNSILNNLINIISHSGGYDIDSDANIVRIQDFSIGIYYFTVNAGETFGLLSVATSCSSDSPSGSPSKAPTLDPTINPTVNPTIDPTIDPTINPTIDPTSNPSTDPTVDPTTTDPTSTPTIHPTLHPTANPTMHPTKVPTLAPTTPAPTEPSRIVCNELQFLEGDYNGVPVTFEVFKAIPGQMLFDANINPNNAVNVTRVVDADGNNVPFISQAGEDGAVDFYIIEILSPNTVLFVTVNSGTRIGKYTIGVLCPLSAAPTTAPTFDICTSNDSLNIAFLLDESGSIDQAEWTYITDFVERVITYDVSPESYVALYEFASLASYQELLPFLGPRLDAANLATYIDTLQNNAYNPSGQTETWDAVNRVLDDMHAYTSTGADCNSNGDSCWQRQNVLFLITDGEPTGTPVCGDMAIRMNQSDVDIVIVLIDPNGDIDESLVSCLDVRNNGADLIRLDEFDSDAFNAIEGRIRDKICANLYPQTDGVQPAYNPWQYCDANGQNCTTDLGPIPTRSGGGQGGDADPVGFNNRIIVDEYIEDQDQVNDIKNNSPWIYIGIAIFMVLILVFGLVIKRLLFDNVKSSYSATNIESDD